MAERLKAPVLKTGVREHRGFESLSFRLHTGSSVWIERGPSKPMVAGSNPARCADRTKNQQRRLIMLRDTGAVLWWVVVGVWKRG